LEVACAQAGTERKRTGLAKQRPVRPLRDKNRPNPNGNGAAV